MNSNEHMARFGASEGIRLLRIPEASMVTISPGSISQMKLAPTTSRAQVSLATMYPDPPGASGSP